MSEYKIYDVSLFAYSNPTAPDGQQRDPSKCAANVEHIAGPLSDQTGVHVIVTRAASAAFWPAARRSLVRAGFVIVCLDADAADFAPPADFLPCSRIAVAESARSVLLLRHIDDADDGGDLTVVDVSHAERDEFAWLERLQAGVARRGADVVVLAQGDPVSGVLGLVNCVRREPWRHEGARSVSCVFVMDAGGGGGGGSGGTFDVQSKVYAAQLRLRLAVNVYKNVSAIRFEY